jgi:hypothetical protein
VLVILVAVFTHDSSIEVVLALLAVRPVGDAIRVEMKELGVEGPATVILFLTVDTRKEYPVSEFSPVTVIEVAAPTARGPNMFHDVNPCCWYSIKVSVRLFVPFDQLRFIELAVGLLVIRPYGGATSVDTAETVAVGVDDTLFFTVDIRKKYAVSEFSPVTVIEASEPRGS